MARQTIPPESPIFTPGQHAHANSTHVSTRRAKAIALLRVAFGLIWAIAAWLKWQPQFITSFSAHVSGVLLAIAAGRYFSVDQWLTRRLGRFGFLAVGVP